MQHRAPAVGEGLVGLHGAQQLVPISRHPAEVLERAVGNYLVGVHVGTGAGTTLDRIDNKVLIELSIYHFLAGKLNVLGFFNLKPTNASIDAGSS